MRYLNIWARPATAAVRLVFLFNKGDMTLLPFIGLGWAVGPPVPGE